MASSATLLSSSSSSSSSSSYFLLLLATAFISSSVANGLYSDLEVYHLCAKSSFSYGSSYQHNLNAVVACLAYNSSIYHYNYAYQGSTDKDTVYGISNCQGDLTESDCFECVAQIAKIITQQCPNATGARVQLDGCYMRYENQRFITQDDTHEILLLNIANSSDKIFQQNRDTVLSKVVENAPSNRGFYVAVAGEDVTDKVYGIAQCLGYLSQQECTQCLSQVSGYTSLFGNAVGGRVYYSTCFYRYERYPFFTQQEPLSASPSPSISSTSPTSPTTEIPSPTSRGPTSPTTEIPSPTSRGPTSPTTEIPPPHAKSSRTNRNTLIVAVTITPAALLSLLLLCLYFILRRRKQSRKAQTDSAADDVNSSTSFPQATNMFSLAELQIATADFHPANKLGEGGFGSVYKGKLEDGQDVAIKKLSSVSHQGKREFLNEINLITAVQHRNLIKLLGCCVEKSERLLVYEYLPQKSLDKHIFDSDDDLITDWRTRREIVLGTARGLAYLHEDSHVKIIHRDIKTSNVLLDDSFNPKIADFGLARPFPEEQSHVISTRIAGTRGYLAPEYAMNGRLTEKADVFSFGVLALETISGRRNTDVNLPPEKQRLLPWAWKMYEEQRPLEVLDQRLGNNFFAEDIVRAVHVALLCVQGAPESRPTMSTVVMMLARPSDILEIPLPPAFADSRYGSGASPWRSNVTSKEVITRTSISDVAEPR